MNTSEETRQHAPDEGFLETCVSVVARPVPTLRGVVRRRPIAWAFVIVIAISVAQGLVQAASLDPSDFGDEEWLAGTPQEIFIVGAPIAAVAGLAFVSGAYWVISRILGGQGPYSGLFAGLAFASVPYALTIPVGFLALPLGTPGGVLSSLVSFGVGIWTLVLSVIVVRENNGFSTGRAMAAVLVPLAVLVVIVMVLVVLLLAFVFVSIIATDGELSL